MPIILACGKTNELKNASIFKSCQFDITTSQLGFFLMHFLSQNDGL